MKNTILKTGIEVECFTLCEESTKFNTKLQLLCNLQKMHDMLLITTCHALTNCSLWCCLHWSYRWIDIWHPHLHHHPHHGGYWIVLLAVQTCSF